MAAPGADSIVVDCSVVVKWELTAEPQAVEAMELLLDWQHKAVVVHAPGFLFLETSSALLRAQRQGRIAGAAAAAAVTALLGLPYLLLDVTAAVAARAYELAVQHNQKVYDCTYVALAEQHQFDLWTGDQRLYNAMRHHCSFIRWLGDYAKKRP